MKQLTQLDMWILSTYQRLERIDAPIFDITKSQNILEMKRTVEEASLYLLPTDLPRKSQSLANRVSGKLCKSIQALTKTQQISLLFRYLSSAMRFEPHNENPIHKTVPSARCMYPLRFILVTKTHGAIVAFEYKSDFHALQRVEVNSDMAHLMRDVDAAVICLSNNWVAAGKYGEFSHFPCLLEGGHALSQLNHLVGLFNWDSNAVIPRDLGHLYCQGDFEIPLFITGLTVDLGDLTKLPVHHCVMAKTIEPSGLKNRFPRLIEINSLFNKDQLQTNVLDAAQPDEQLSLATPLVQHAIPDIDLFELMRARHSGNNRGGVAAISKHVASDQLSKIINLWHAISNMRRKIPSEHSLSLSFGWLSSSGPRIGLYNSEGELLTPELSPTEFAARMKATLPYKEMRFNTSSLAMTFIISADPIEAIANHGDSALRDMLLAAGAAAQDLSYAATAVGMFARPVRMMREECIETAFPVEGQVLYQVLCGFNRRSNLTFEVL